MEKSRIRNPEKHLGSATLVFTANNCRLNPPIGEEVRYTDQEYEDSSDAEREGVTAPGHRVHRTR
jgi:hypothetical protein